MMNWSGEKQRIPNQFEYGFGPATVHVHWNLWKIFVFLFVVYCQRLNTFKHIYSNHFSYADFYPSYHFIDQFNHSSINIYFFFHFLSGLSLLSFHCSFRQRFFPPFLVHFPHCQWTLREMNYLLNDIRSTLIYILHVYVNGRCMHVFCYFDVVKTYFFLLIHG